MKCKYGVLLNPDWWRPHWDYCGGCCRDLIKRFEEIQMRRGLSLLRWHNWRDMVRFRHGMCYWTAVGSWGVTTIFHDTWKEMRFLARHWRLPQ